MAVDFPAPEKPVITTRSVSAELRMSASSGVSSSMRPAGRRSPSPLDRETLMRVIVPTCADARVNRRSMAGLVELRVDVARDLAGQSRDRLQLLTARRQERLWRAEVLQQGPLAR